MSYVVAVAGPSGGGKTSVVRGLVEQLGDASAIYMDSYERMTREPIGNVRLWTERGADVEELPVPLLAEHLRRLKRGETVVEPAGQTAIVPRKYILFETQFGRVHRATGAQIDLLVWVDTPLEIALARRLKAFCAEALRAARAGGAWERIEWLDAYLANYLSLVRRLLLLQSERVRPHADVVVDGSGGLDAIVRQLRDQILERMP
ncbi:MAG: hypothetical protein ACREVC_03355 [Burkholderiales bacterium]